MVGGPGFGTLVEEEEKGGSSSLLLGLSLLICFPLTLSWNCWTVSAMAQSICLRERAAVMTSGQGCVRACALWVHGHMDTCCFGFGLACRAESSFFPPPGTMGVIAGETLFWGKHRVGKRCAQSPE